MIKEDVKNTTFDELVKIVDTIKSNKQNLEEKIEGVNKKLSDTIKFNVTKGFNRLTKIDFFTRLAEASPNLSTKKQVQNAFYLGYKNR